MFQHRPATERGCLTRIGRAALRHLDAVDPAGLFVVLFTAQEMVTRLG
jgi:hypothetical protein